ncbi:hypothetical protein NEISICOT_02230 [Neisseria sicca ATCC 29256]|uniref:Uncharacterized protein n=1 Tax=Neisseria sicca ATCC 29256 TaxID=547045 RepID=C6M6S7_NEISI|nr:hypothetical protein NEISICOT_02230 [Neisseria sicca ATCC 29256]
MRNSVKKRYRGKSAYRHANYRLSVNQIAFLLPNQIDTPA